VNGKPVAASVARNTILVTDRNTFRFPKQSGVGTHPAGHFTVNPNTTPKQVDSIAEGGSNAGQLTRGIYEIIDATHKRAYWGAAWWSAADRVQVASGKRANSSVLQENRACAFALIFETPPDSR